MTNIGWEYVGNKSTTWTGRTCQRWDVVTPHDVVFRPYPDFAHNYCRNPGHLEIGPWCYTTDAEVRQESCEIPLCGKSE